MATVGAVIVKLLAQTDRFRNDLNGAVSQTQSASERMSRAGQIMTMGLTMPIIGAATGMLKLGVEFDQAYDKIRIGTGATGVALAGLQEDFRAIYQTVPSGMADVSTAVADLNTRMGLTGEPLREMATQMLNLSRIAGIDIASAIASSTRLLGDWAVQSDDSADAMDYLFRVSQSTGIQFGRLNDMLVQFGAPLRQMGFDLETSAAMLGKFEREGVNTELVLGGLRIALGRMAREGITDANAALMEAKRRIQEAGSASEANAIALEMFGARVGPDMAAAIREGRFELDDLVASLEASSETINKAAADTNDFAEELAIMRNRAAVALEPLGTAMMQAINSAMPAIERLIDRLVALVNWFTNLDARSQTVILAFVGIVGAVGPVLKILAGITGAVTALNTAIVMLKATLAAKKVGLLVLLAPFAKVSAAVALLAGGAYLVTTNWDRIGPFFSRLGTTIKDTVGGVIDTAQGLARDLADGTLVGRVLEAGRNLITSFADGMRERLERTRTAVAAITATVHESLADGTLVQRVLEAGRNLATNIAAGISERLPYTSAAVAEITAAVHDGVANAILARRVLEAGRNLIINFADGISERPELVGTATAKVAAAVRDELTSGELTRRVLEAGWNLIVGFADGIRARVQGVIGAAREIGIAAWESLTSGELIGRVLEAGRNLITNLATGIGNAVQNVIDAGQNIGARIVEVLNSDALLRQMWTIGGALITSFAHGISAAVQSVIDAVQNIGATAIARLKEILDIRSPSMVFYKIGLNIARGLADGIRAGYDLVGAAAEGLVDIARLRARATTELNIPPEAHPLDPLRQPRELQPIRPLGPVGRLTLPSPDEILTAAARQLRIALDPIRNIPPQFAAALQPLDDLSQTLQLVGKREPPPLPPPAPQQIIDAAIREVAAVLRPLLAPEREQIPQRIIDAAIREIAAVLQPLEQLYKAPQPALLPPPVSQQIVDAATQEFAAVMKGLEQRIIQAPMREIPAVVELLEDLLYVPPQEYEPPPMPPLMAALNFVLAPLAQFAGLLQQINPVAALVAGAMQVLQPAIETLIYPLVMVGSIIANALMPILQALFPVFKLLGIAVLGVAIGIGAAWNLIATALNAILGWLGIRIPMIDLAAMMKGMEELINLTWEEAEARQRSTEALNYATESLLNVPDIWKVAHARWRAADAEAASYGIGSHHVAGSHHGKLAGNTTVYVTVVTNDPAEIWRKLEPYLQARKYRVTGNQRLALLGG